MFYLVIAIFLEITATTCMKMSAGFTHILPSILVFISYTFCCVFFTLSLQTVEIGTAYAVGAGLGTFLVALIGIFYFNEPITPIKLIGALLSIAGIILLQFPKI